jgi:hypothetical protein
VVATAQARASRRPDTQTCAGEVHDSGVRQDRGAASERKKSTCGRCNPHQARRRPRPKTAHRRTHEQWGPGGQRARACWPLSVIRCFYATNQPDTDPHWQPRLVLPRGIPHAFTVVESTKIFKSIHPLPNIHSLPRASPRQPMLAITIEHGHLDLALLLFRTRCSGSRCSGVSCGSRFLPLLVWLAAVAELPCCCNIWARFSSHSGEGSAK